MDNLSSSENVLWKYTYKFSIETLKMSIAEATTEADTKIVNVRNLKKTKGIIRK